MNASVVINELPILEMKSSSTQKDFREQIASIEIKLNRMALIEQSSFRPYRKIIDETRSRNYKTLDKENQMTRKTNNMLTYSLNNKLSSKTYMSIKPKSLKSISPIKIKKQKVFYKLGGNIDMKNLIEESPSSYRSYQNYLKSNFDLIKDIKQDNQENYYKSVNFSQNQLENRQTTIVIDKFDSIFSEEAPGKSKRKLSKEKTNEEISPLKNYLKRKSFNLKLGKLNINNTNKNTNAIPLTMRNLKGPDFSKQLDRDNVARHKEKCHVSDNRLNVDHGFIALEHKMIKSTIRNYDTLVYSQLKLKDEDSFSSLGKFNSRVKQFDKELTRGFLGMNKKLNFKL